MRVEFPKLRLQGIEKNLRMLYDTDFSDTRFSGTSLSIKDEKAARVWCQTYVAPHVPHFITIIRCKLFWCISWLFLYNHACILWDSSSGVKRLSCWWVVHHLGCHCSNKNKFVGHCAGEASIPSVFVSVQSFAIQWRWLHPACLNYDTVGVKLQVTEMTKMETVEKTMTRLFYQWTQHTRHMKSMFRDIRGQNGNRWLFAL